MKLRRFVRDQIRDTAGDVDLVFQRVKKWLETELQTQEDLEAINAELPRGPENVRYSKEIREIVDQTYDQAGGQEMLAESMLGERMDRRENPTYSSMVDALVEQRLTVPIKRMIREEAERWRADKNS